MIPAALFIRGDASPTDHSVRSTQSDKVSDPWL